MKNKIYYMENDLNNEKQKEIKSNNEKQKEIKSNLLPKYSIILPCIHIPFQNQNILDKIYDLIRKEKKNINRIILLGDFLDLNSLSYFTRGQLPLDGIDLFYEYNEGLKVINQINLLCNKTDIKKIFMVGNHEDRYYRNMKDIQNSKLGKALPDPISYLQLKETAWEIHNNYKNDYIKIKDFQLLHGEYWNEYAAKKHTLLSQSNIIFAHTHRIQLITSGSFVGYNIGWLGDAKSEAFEYSGRLRRDQWNLGFAILTETEKQAWCNIVEVKKNNFIWNGEIY